jgi:vacuolar-type H+-ATPase subunit I/STV1
MTDTSMTPESPDVAETIGFLRRFAGMMSTGNNATYLHRAAELLEALTARVIAAADEEEVSRYKYETATHQVEMLEAECEALKHDIEGHLSVTSTVLTERDAVKKALQARETEVAELRDASGREREAHNAALALRDAELDRLRAALGREKEDSAEKLKARDAELAELRTFAERELAELRLASGRERGEFQVQLKVQGDELSALRIVSERERDALTEKVTSLEAKRAELRAAFDRISDLRHQTVEPEGGASVSGQMGLEAPADPVAAQPGGRNPAVGETDTVVPKSTLRQARAQFEYLAKQFVPLGDIASQVMCELGAYNMDLALVAGQQSDHLPVGDVARSILAPAGSAGRRADA